MKSDLTHGLLALAAACVLSGSALADAWDAPANYYNGATGTGTTLSSQLRTIMSSGHTQRSYGDYRYSAAITDADPNNPGRILLVYNRASVSGGWDSGGTWNREHVWPQSKQPGDASNSTRGNLGDPHALRPATPSVNGSRGNKPFGGADLTGGYRSNGSYYFPGDADKGDIARALFYSSTRYGLTLTDGAGGSNSMGDLASLVAWNYQDTPDEFERRRNHTIYSSAYNPSYYTNNRNAYTDHPEYVWSVFVDQQNDSQLYVGDVASGDGASALAIDLGSVIVGAPLNATTNVALNKRGQDGTYYEVLAVGDATSSITGRYNAFAINSSGIDSTTLTVGLDVSTSVPRHYSGQVYVDNLDVTTQGGAGRGANDAVDAIDLSATVLTHATPSFSGGGQLLSLSYDFGEITQGAASPLFDFDVFNLESLAGLTAGLDLDGLAESGDQGVFALTGPDFTGLAAGAASAFFAEMDTSVLGDFGAQFVFSLSDEDLPGATALAGLTLTLTGSIVAVPEPGALLLVIVTLTSATFRRRLRG